MENHVGADTHTAARVRVSARAGIAAHGSPTLRTLFLKIAAHGKDPDRSSSWRILSHKRFPMLGHARPRGEEV